MAAVATTTSSGLHPQPHISAGSVSSAAQRPSDDEIRRAHAVVRFLNQSAAAGLAVPGAGDNTNPAAWEALNTGLAKIVSGPLAAELLGDAFRHADQPMISNMRNIASTYPEPAAAPPAGAPGSPPRVRISATLTPAPPTRSGAIDKAKAADLKAAYVKRMTESLRYAQVSDMQAHLKTVEQLHIAITKFRDFFFKNRLHKTKDVGVSIRWATGDKQTGAVVGPVHEARFFFEDILRAERLFTNMLYNTKWYLTARRHRDVNLPKPEDYQFIRSHVPHVLGEPLVFWVNNEDLGMRGLKELPPFSIGGTTVDLTTNAGFREGLLMASFGVPALDQVFAAFRAKVVDAINGDVNLEKYLLNRPLHPLLDEHTIIPAGLGDRASAMARHNLNASASLLSQGYALKSTFLTLLDIIPQIGIADPELRRDAAGMLYENFGPNYTYGLKRGKGPYSVLTTAMRQAFVGMPSTFVYRELVINEPRAKSRVTILNDVNINTLEAIRQGTDADHNPEFEMRKAKREFKARAQAASKRAHAVQEPVGERTFQHTNTRSIASLNSFYEPKEGSGKTNFVTAAQSSILNDPVIRMIMLRESRYVSTVHKMHKVDVTKQPAKRVHSQTGRVEGAQF